MPPLPLPHVTTEEDVGSIRKADNDKRFSAKLLSAAPPAGCCAMHDARDVVGPMDVLRAVLVKTVAVVAVDVSMPEGDEGGLAALWLLCDDDGPSF